VIVKYFILFLVPPPLVVLERGFSTLRRVAIIRFCHVEIWFEIILVIWRGHRSITN
jgi:hypothetical protein